MSTSPPVILVPILDCELDSLFAMFADYWAELDTADPLTPLPYGVPEYRSALLDDREGRELLWIVVDKERVGFAFTHIGEDWPDDTLVAEVSEFYILPESRHAGIGRTAVAALAERCRTAGATRLEAEVLTGNVAALAFWHLCGLTQRRHSFFRRL